MNQSGQVGWLSLLALVLVTSLAWPQNPAMRPDMPARILEIRPQAPEITQRFISLQRELQPSARSWVEEQARREMQRPTPDLAALRVQVRSRFAGSEASANSVHPQPPKATNIPSGADIEAMVFVVLMQAANDTDQDLQQIMAEVKAETAAKQKLRDLANEVIQEAASARPGATRQPCRTSICQSLPGELSPLAVTTARTKHPVRIAVPGNLTYAALQQLGAQMQLQADGLDDLSQQDQLQLQMLMDKRSQFEQMLSNIMKSQQDTASSVVSNLK